MEFKVLEELQVSFYTSYFQIVCLAFYNHNNNLCIFRWDYLTEKFAYEKRVKENKLKVAMMQVRHHCNV